MSADSSDDDKNGSVKGRKSSSRQHESDRRGRRKYRIASVREALNFRAADLIMHFRGDKPTGGARNGEIRWGCHGSFVLKLSGRYRGCYYDFEAGEGGDLFKFIMRQLGLSFSEAVEWAAGWVGFSGEYEPRAEETSRQEKQDRARAQKEAQEAAQEAAAAARSRAHAQKIWNESGRIEGTLGEKYLRDTRKIGVDRFPASIRWSVRERAIVCAVMDDTGQVVAIQKIAVTRDGTKDNIRWLGKGGAKKSLGPIGSGAVRLPGETTGPLCICEGLETGLSVWAATGFETIVLLGGMGRAADLAQAGRKVIICRDDDKFGSSAAKTANKAVRSLRANGFDVREAWPHPIRRGDKSDFNDLTQERGLDAVRERIALAASDMAQPIPEYLRLDEARLRVRELVGVFFQTARNWPNERESVSLRAILTRVHAIGLEVGGGKTEAAIDDAIRLLIDLRKVGDNRVVVILTPGHSLAADIERRVEEKLKAAGSNLVSMVWRGRAARVRPDSDERMCQAHETVNEAIEILAELGTEVCCKKACQFFDGCQYRLQKGVINVDIWIGAHNLLFNSAPTPIRDRGIVAIVVDEGPFQAGLQPPLEIPLDAIDNYLPLPKKENDRLDLMYARHLLAQALFDEPDGYVRRAAVTNAPDFNIRSNLAKRAKQLEWQRKIKKRQVPKWREREGNRSVRPMAAIWGAIVELLADDGPEVSGRLKIERDKRGVRLLSVTGRSEIHADWDAPTLLIDALHDPELINPFWPLVQDMGHIRIAAPFQRVRQATGKSYSLSHLSPNLRGNDESKKTRAGNRRRLRALILRLDRETGGKTLVVGNKAVIQAMDFPDHIEVAWFGAVAGRDNWKDVRLIVIVGRPQPNPADVEWMASALTGRAVQELGKGRNIGKFDVGPADSWYKKGDAFRYHREDSGITCTLSSADLHPDAFCESFRERICVGEIVQAIGRGRGVNRTEATPLDVVVLTDVPLPLPVDEFLPDDAMKVGPLDLMLAEGDFAFRSGRSAAEAYPSLWGTSAAAQRAIERALSEMGDTNPFNATNAYKEASIGKCRDVRSLCPLVRFRRWGVGEREQLAIYDPRIVTDPRSALETSIGPLAEFEMIGPESCSHDRPEKPKKHSHDAETYLMALCEALGQKGQVIRATGSNLTEMFAVNREIVRAEFKRQRGIDNADRRAVDACKKAFQRGEAKVRAAGPVEIVEIDDEKFVRLIQPNGPATASATRPLPIVSTSDATFEDFRSLYEPDEMSGTQPRPPIEETVQDKAAGKIAT
ncbi:toprim domain-containing protein [Rhodoblastus sp. 17X3]|uniref:DUF7146 domain-containing protein n=1 Tax=Rhodoblastus sp. 17X3 TaxID=3047026 RepID=UPI0024B6874D|nr:toprim domain-containing protein [Rhodoblastus sp. 17X3]MDI9846739.1 toprim domain-containing protein [Rhodoblastus sp. 17X3]